MEEVLKEIVENNPEVEAVFIVDEEGIVISSYTRKELAIDPEEIAVQITHPLNRLIEMVKEISEEKEELEELLMFTTAHILFSYKLINDTYLVVLAKKDALYGKVRFKIRYKLPQIIEVL